MDIVLLIKSGMGLVVILAVLVFFLFYSSQKKKEKVVEKKEPVKPKKVEKVRDFAALRAVLVNNNSTSQELKEALDMIIKNYGTISKSGKNLQSDFDVYMGILFNICRHPHTTKDIILDFDRELTNINPQYKSEINEAVTKALNSR